MTKNEDLNIIKEKIEAILFSYGEWLSITEIKNVLKVDSQNIIKNAIKDLELKFNEGYSFKIINEDDKYRMILKKEYEELVEELISGVEIPKKVLKVLSVIAYEQPVSKTRLAEIIGKYVKEEVDYLFKHGFISYEKRGIGRFYKVTKKFYEYFNLDNDDFREKANKNITSFLEEEIVSKETPEDKNLLDEDYSKKN